MHRGFSMAATYHEDQIAEGKMYYVNIGSGGA